MTKNKNHVIFVQVSQSPSPLWFTSMLNRDCISALASNTTGLLLPEVCTLAIMDDTTAYMFGAHCGKQRHGLGFLRAGALSWLLSCDKDLMSSILQLIDWVGTPSKNPALSLAMQGCCLTPVVVNPVAHLANQNGIKHTILAQCILFFSALC